MSAEPEPDLAPDVARESDEAQNRIELMDRRARRSGRMIFGFFAGLVAIVASIPMYRRHVVTVRNDRIAAIARHESMAVGTPAPRPPLEIILADALPRWLMALQFRDEPQGAGEIAAAYTALRALAVDDAAALARIERVHDMVDAGIIANADAIVAVFRDWNTALDAAHEPYHLRPIVQHSATRVLLAVSAYRVSFDGHATVGARSVRLRLLARIDRTNMREVLLGHVSDADEGALILTDRIRDAAVRDFWPMFDPTPGREVTPVRRAQQSLVLHELRAALPPSAIATLSRLAPVFGQLVATASAINARASCGSSFRLTFIPAHGVSSHDLETIAHVVDTAADNDSCPAVTDDELETLITNSERLAFEPQLDAAIASLSGWLTRSVAVHESRHAADAIETGSIYVPLPCNGCPPALTIAESAELSAYLASFAAPATAYTSLYQACVAVGGARNIHGNALAAATERLMFADCATPPPPDLVARAGAAEQAVFGRSEAIVLPDAPY